MKLTDTAAKKADKSSSAQTAAAPKASIITRSSTTHGGTPAKTKPAGAGNTGVGAESPGGTVARGAVNFSRAHKTGGANKANKPGGFLSSGISDSVSARKKEGRTDFYILAAVLLLSVCGLIMIYSASNYSALKDYNDAFLYAKKQLPGFFAGTVLMLFFWRFPYQKLSKYRYLFLAVTFVMLVLVFVPGIGIENFGSKRWIGAGSFSLQPSEFAKFAFILFAAYYMSNSPEKMQTFLGTLPVLAVGGAFCVLIILEPNMSITVCMGLLMLGMMFIGGCKKNHFAIIFIPALLLIPVMIIMEPYRMNRLTAFLDPWASPKKEGYQLIQSLYALGGGGWFGVGLFNSRQKFDFLPFSESDFIFSIVGEELGLFGALAVLALFLFLIFRGIKTAVNAGDLFGCYLAAGITMITAIQVAVNVAVVTGSIPPTGLPLPFISYGGSSLMVFMGAYGVILNISRTKSIL